VNPAVTIQSPVSRKSWFLIGTAVFAYLWVIARACVQSLTIDEADTFLASVLRPYPSHWEAGSNNHVLNSALARLFTMIFGASPLTLRLPALIGSAIYIVAAFCLVQLVTRSRLLQWSLLVCLTFNPFVMDYLVAARGYSLALAFLTCALLAAARYAGKPDEEKNPEALYKCAAVISACMALSISANFSFAVADVVTTLLIMAWIGRNRAARPLKTLAAFVAPGVAIGYFIVGATLLSWPKGQFTWGATSLIETGRSMLQASLFEPNAFLLNPRLRHYFVHFGTWLYPMIAIFLLWRVATLLVERPALRSVALALVCGVSLICTLAIHQILFSAVGILLPLDRTGLFLALLILVTAGTVAAVPALSRVSRIPAVGLTATLTLIAVYSIGCLRLTYFKEWKYDADMKKVYSVLAYYNHTFGIRDVSVNWRYVATLNAYRQMSGGETLRQIPGAPTAINEYPTNYQAYVIYNPWDWEFAKREGLKTVYVDDFSGAAVAIRPEVETVKR
jgi:hypothetical protein